MNRTFGAANDALLAAKLQSSSDSRNVFAQPEFNRETAWQNVRLLKQHYVQAIF